MIKARVQILVVSVMRSEILRCAQDDKVVILNRDDKVVILSRDDKVVILSRFSGEESPMSNIQYPTHAFSCAA